jgi:hypothetical protein
MPPLEVGDPPQAAATSVVTVTNTSDAKQCRGVITEAPIDLGWYF